MIGKYKVITLCGSTRFKDEFIEAQKRLTLEGNINPKISQTRIAKEIGVSRSTIQRAFGKLIESGQVQRTGGTRGSWIIQEKH